jgi:hypothetical protein
MTPLKTKTIKYGVMINAKKNKRVLQVNSRVNGGRYAIVFFGVQ